MYVQKKALTNHVNVNHLGRRDFVCPHADCRRAFGYKHLLQRHLTRLHVPESDDDETSEGSNSEDEEDADQQKATFSIDDITGASYSAHAKVQVLQAMKLQCPHPDVAALIGDDARCLPGRSTRCQYAFSRAYDLRRHLKSEHDLEADKEQVDLWVRQAQRAVRLQDMQDSS